MQLSCGVPTLLGQWKTTLVCLFPRMALYFVKCQVLRRLTHSFRKYLLITYYVLVGVYLLCAGRCPPTIAGTVFTAMNEAA